MAFCVVILAIAAIYCLWIARKDEAAMHGLLHGEARSRRENNARWHKRAAVLSIIGMGIAFGAMLWR